MPDGSIGTRVPSEFVGMARSFRAKILAADDRANAVILEVFEPLAGRARRHPMPRQELLAAASRGWALGMPADGRLGEFRIRKSKRELTISEARLCAGHLQRREWGEGVYDPGLAVSFTEMRVGEGVCTMTVDVVVLLSLHSLARWFQRSLDNSETALLADLGVLAASYGGILYEHEQTLDSRFRVPVASGAWVGEVNRRYSEATLKEERVASVATFLSAD